MGDLLLPELLSTGRCHWRTIQSKPLSLAAPRTAQLHWDVDDAGAQTPRFIAESEYCSPFFIEQAWYYDESQSAIGLLNTGVDPKVAQLLVAAPKILPEHTQTVANFLQNHEQQVSIKAPKQFTRKTLKNEKPVPCLRLFQAELPTHYYQSANTRKALAELTFEYQGGVVHCHDRKETLHRLEDDTLLSIKRNKPFESKAFDQLVESDFVLISVLPETPCVRLVVTPN